MSLVWIDGVGTVTAPADLAPVRRLPTRAAVGGTTTDFAEVLAEAQAGDAQAWEAIYRSVAPQVRGYLRSRGAHEADDLLGDVFVQLATGIGRFKGDEAQFRSWVFMIAHHRVIDEHRRRARRPPPDPLDPEAVVADSADPATEATGGLALTETLDLMSLTDDQRAVLELRFVATLTIDEIADVVGKAPGAVKALQRRALATLRRHLGDEAVSL